MSNTSKDILSVRNTSKDILSVSNTYNKWCNSFSVLGMAPLKFYSLSRSECFDNPVSSSERTCWVTSGQGCTLPRSLTISNTWDFWYYSLAAWNFVTHILTPSLMTHPEMLDLVVDIFIVSRYRTKRSASRCHTHSLVSRLP